MLGLLEESALQDVLGCAETLRTWHQKLISNPESSSAAATSAAAAVAAITGSIPRALPVKSARGTVAVGKASEVSAGGEFGADILIHAARLAGDPDAAVLAMCGSVPGSDVSGERCGAEASPLREIVESCSPANLSEKECPLK